MGTLPDTYLFKLKGYNDAIEESYVEHGSVAAMSYEDAMRRIENRFDDLDEIYIIRVWSWDGFTFLEEDAWNNIVSSERIQSEQENGLDLLITADQI